MLAVVVGGDEELVEEELVEHAADVFGCLQVGVSGVLGDVERDRDEFVGFGDIGGEVAEAAVGGGQFGVEAFLLGAEHIDGDRVVVVGFEELALATLDSLLRGLELFPFKVGVGAMLLQSVPEECFEVAAKLGRETDAVVEILDQVFGVFDLDGAEGAAGALGVSSEAGVVRVGFAVTVLDDLDDHAESAVPAVHRGLEVVVVLDGAFSVDLLFQDGLDFFEGFAVDERGVVAGVLNAFECGDAGVVDVGEHRVDVADLDRLLHEPRGGYCCESSPDEFFGEGAYGVFTGGVGVERPGDQWRAPVVDGDGAVLAAVFDGAGVEVADRCAADGAAVLDLLAHAFDDFVGEVAGVELGDRAHDAVEEDAAGSLVDVLAGGDEPDAEFAEPLVKGDVVGAVACETVQLVHDDVIDVALLGFEVAQHLLERGAVGGGAGDATLDELFDDHRTDGLSLLLVRVALRRDRESFFPAAAFRLLARRDAQV
nr:hypothetical protein [Leucobacter chromiireducens]